MPYLPESLESILRQSYSDFEILVINDGSTDDSRGYLESIRDPRLRIVDQENRGLTATLNRMLAEARTPWLARHDADDVAFPHRLARAVNYISRYPESGMFYSLGQYYPAGSVGRYRTTTGNPGEIRDLVRSGYLLAICHVTVILNVERTTAVGGYRFNLHVEDTDLWWRLALHHDISFHFRKCSPESGRTCKASPPSTLRSKPSTHSTFNTFSSPICGSGSHWRTKKPVTHCYSSLIREKWSLGSTFEHLTSNWAVVISAGLSPKPPQVYLPDVSCAGCGRISPRRAITMGESPSLFRKYENILWPNHADDYCAAIETLPPRHL